MKNPAKVYRYSKPYRYQSINIEFTLSRVESLHETCFFASGGYDRGGGIEEQGEGQPRYTSLRPPPPRPPPPTKWSYACWQQLRQCKDVAVQSSWFKVSFIM